MDNFYKIPPIRFIIGVFLLASLLIACSDTSSDSEAPEEATAASEVAAATTEPTATAEPTATDVPTATLEPTATATPEPTDTPAPAFELQPAAMTTGLTFGLPGSWEQNENASGANEGDVQLFFGTNKTELLDADFASMGDGVLFTAFTFAEIGWTLEEMYAEFADELPGSESLQIVEQPSPTTIGDAMAIGGTYAVNTDGNDVIVELRTAVTERGSIVLAIFSDSEYYDEYVELYSAIFDSVEIDNFQMDVISNPAPLDDVDATIRPAISMGVGQWATGSFESGFIEAYDLAVQADVPALMLAYPNGGSDPVLRAMSAIGNITVDDRSAGSAEALMYTATEPETIAVQILEAGNGVDDYTFIAAPANAFYEEGALDDNGSASFDTLIPADNSLVVFVISNESFDAVLTIENEAGDTVAMVDGVFGGIIEHVVFRPESEGIFTVTLREFDGLPGAYTLAAGFTGATVGEPQPSESNVPPGLSSRPLLSGNVISERLLPDAQMQFMLETISGEFIAVIEPLTPDMDATLSVIDWEGETIRAADAGLAGEREVILYSTSRTLEDRLIEVGEFDDGGGDFSLLVLEADIIAIGTFTDSGTSDESFAVEAGQKFFFAVDGGSDFSALVTLRDSAGNVLLTVARTPERGASLLIWDVEQADELVVEIAYQFSGDDGSFSFASAIIE